MSSPYIIYYNNNLTAGSNKNGVAISVTQNNVPFWDNTVVNKNGERYAPGYTVEEDLFRINAHNKTNIAGRVLAGITLSVDVHSKRGTNALTNPGKDKGNPVITGIKPASFSITQLIWDAANHYLLTDQLKELWVNNIGKQKPQELSIEHPILAQIGIQYGYLVSLTGLKEHASGGRTITLEFLEKKSATNKSAAVANPKIVNTFNTTLVKPSQSTTPFGLKL